MSEADLEMVLAWRNHPKVRRFMYTRHVINLDEHTKWFEDASADSKRHLLIYQVGIKAQGFINIHELAPGGIANWGFYVAPDAPKGTGSALGSAALRHAFQALKLHKLCGQTIASNKRSIRFHLRLGFSKEGTLQQQHFDGEKYHDVWCFGLLAHVWANRF